MAENRQDEKKMEALLQTYERKNQELEERELEVRYRLQMLENTMPALMMWNLWRMMMSFQTAGGGVVTGGPYVPVQGKGPTACFSADFEPNAPVRYTTPVQAPHIREEEPITRHRTSENKVIVQNRHLEDHRSSEELKGKLRDLEKLIGKEQVLGDIIDQEVDQDVGLFDKLEKMAQESDEMVKRIKDLEFKERLYKETMEHADNFTNQLENKLDTSLKEKNLMSQMSGFNDKESTNRPEDVDSISSERLEEKVLAIDNELTRVRDELTMMEKEKVILEGAERKVLQEFQEAMNELEKMRGEVEGPLRAKIELSQKRSRAIEEELNASKIPSRISSKIPSKIPSQVRSRSITSTPTIIAESNSSKTKPRNQPQTSPATVLTPDTHETSFIESVLNQSPTSLHLFVYLFIALLALKNV